jgi:hypothetical protein
LLFSNYLRFQFFKRNCVRPVSVQSFHYSHGLLSLEWNSYSETQTVQLVDGDISSLIFILLTEDVINSSLEVHRWRHLLQNTSLQPVETVLDNGLVSRRQLFVLENHLGRTEHLDELVVIWDAHREFLLIIVPLGVSNLTVIVSLCSVELVQELDQYLVLGLLSRDHIRVFFGTINTTEVQ